MTRDPYSNQQLRAERQLPPDVRITHATDDDDVWERAASRIDRRIGIAAGVCCLLIVLQIIWVLW